MFLTLVHITRYVSGVFIIFLKCYRNCMQLLYYVSHGEKIYDSKTPWKTVKIFENIIIMIMILPLKLK